MRGYVNFIWLLLPAMILLQCVSARYALPPKFYGQDSAVIVDAEKQQPPSQFNPKLANALYYNIPVYKLIRPGTTTTTPAPETPEEYPSDLLDLARNKLGLKQIDELPSISELGELLGTGSASETIKYIRTLTSNDQGIALMKAYLESLDYAQESEAESPAEEALDEDNDDDDDDNATDNAADADYDDEAPIQPKLKTSSTTTTTTTTTTKSPQTSDGGFLQRMGDFMKQYNFWSESSTPPPPAVSFKPVFVAPPPHLLPAAGAAMRPLLVRQPLPYHYPVPLRPVLLPQPKSMAKIEITTATPSTEAPLHLNSPKHSDAEPEVAEVAIAPHIKQIAQMANISAQVLDRFLQQQPKLAELAKRVSRFPLAQGQSQAMDTQIFGALQRAIAQDEELKRMLNAAQTLK